MVHSLSKFGLRLEITMATTTYNFALLAFTGERLL
jgi:hypothetical protein